MTKDSDQVLFGSYYFPAFVNDLGLEMKTEGTHGSFPFNCFLLISKPRVVSIGRTSMSQEAE